MAQRIVVVRYNPRWEEEFRAEATRLWEALGETVCAIHHIGSTAVPGLDAKPILDIMPVVRDLGDVDAAEGRMRALGYEALGAFGIPGRRYFRKGGEWRTHQVHVFRADDVANWSRHLAFRDWLRARVDCREAYAALKRDLAARFPEDIEGYCDGKEAFVRRAEADALAVYDDTWERLYLAAAFVRRPRRVSGFLTAGEVGAALLADSGAIVTGVCLDAACSWGLCAERTALAALLTRGGLAVRRMVAVGGRGVVMPPCGICREAFLQLGPGAGATEVMLSHEPRRVTRLDTLLPDWWGASGRQR